MKVRQSFPNSLTRYSILLSTLILALLLISCGEDEVTPSPSLATPTLATRTTTSLATVPATIAPSLPAMVTPGNLPTLTPTLNPLDKPPTPSPSPVPPLDPSITTVRSPAVTRLPGNEKQFEADFVDVEHGWLLQNNILSATSDGGKHWTSLYKAEPKFSHIHFFSLKQGMAWLDNQPLTTKDGGVSWQPYPFNRTVDVIYDDGGLLKGAMLGDWPVTFIDANNGWTFTKTPDPRQENNPIPIFTHDSGKTWHKINGQCSSTIGPYDHYSFISATVGFNMCSSQPGAGTQSKALYKTIDGGLHWKLVTDSKTEAYGKLSEGRYVSSIYFIDDKHGWYNSVYSGSDIVQYTDDGGVTWKGFIGSWECEYKMIRVFSPQQSYIDTYCRANSDFGYEAGQHGILYTNDNATNWQQIYPGSIPLGDFRFFDLNNGIGLVSLDNTTIALKSNDGGQTWTKTGLISKSCDKPTDSTLLNMQQIWVLTNCYDKNTRNSERRLYHSNDAGKTWVKINSWNSNPGSDPSPPHKIDFVDENLGYIWLLRELKITHNGGRTFEPAPPDFSPPSKGWAIHNQDGIQIGDPNDKSWKPTFLPKYHIDQFQLLPNGHGWAIVGDCRNDRRVYRCYLLSTADKGKNWVKYDFETLLPAYVQFVDDQHGWLIDLDYHWYSTDNGGNSWQQIH